MTAPSPLSVLQPLHFFPSPQQGALLWYSDYPMALRINEQRTNAVADDPGSVVDGPREEGMVTLDEGDQEHVLLKHRLYTGIGQLAGYCRVVAVRRILHSGKLAKARLGAFQLHERAVVESPNLRHGWFSASKDEVGWIAGGGGFSVQGMPHSAPAAASCGFGLQLSSEGSPSESVLKSVVDGDGLKHVVFCRVIMGNMELVLPGSKQFRPSSGSFDSGVDNLQYPTKYIIWYPDVNTRIPPLYVLSFKMDLRLRGLQTGPVERPSSPWISIRVLISVLRVALPPSTMSVIRRFHSDLMERKITRKQMICHLRKITGDKLLVSAIKSNQKKEISKK